MVPPWHSRKLRHREVKLLPKITQQVAELRLQTSQLVSGADSWSGSYCQLMNKINNNDETLLLLSPDKSPSPIDRQFRAESGLPEESTLDSGTGGEARWEPGPRSGRPVGA